MLCRIGRFGSVQEAGFLDVGPDAWFYEDVCALAEQGVLAKDTFFIPNRTVTRQELVTMLYRLCRALGGKMAPAADSPSERWGRIQDFSEVQEYAREAYLAFEQNGFHLPSDLEEGDIMDTADDRYFLSPDTEMTRGEVIGTAYDFIRWFLIANRPAIAPGACREIWPCSADACDRRFHIDFANDRSGLQHAVYQSPEPPGLSAGAQQDHQFL